MPDSIRVNVKQEDITNGQPGNPCKCPVALAIKRTLPHATYTRVQIRKAVTSGWVGRDYREWYLPEEASIFIERFDRSGELAVSPFEFDMELRPTL